MMRPRPAWGVLCLALMACGAQEAPTPEGAQAALDEGRYEDATRAFRELLDAAPDVAVPGLNRALLATGDYEEILDLPDAHAPPYWKGEALLRLGRSEEAESAFTTAAGAGGRYALTAELRLGELESDRGARDAALQRFDRFIDVYNQGSSLSALDLTAIATAVYRLSITNSDLVHDAQRALGEATSLAAGMPEPRIALGRIFLDKYTSGEAGVEFESVLEINPNHPDALVGMAQVLAFDGQPGSSDLIDQALAVNPRHVGALLTRVRARLRAEDLDGARETAQQALDVNPSSLEARSLLAIADLLGGDDASFERQATEITSDNPYYADLFAEAADMASQHRWYAEAVTLAERGTQVDSLHARSFGELGLNQLRVGAIEAGKASLERAFEMDPFNPWYFNTLKLADTFDRFEHVRTANFDIVLDQREAALLGPYMADVAEQALADLGARYGSLPPLPIRLEVFPNHADFSVRTVGLAGLGALGVSFGSVLAMDSPSARAQGEFNWASTLWHEIAHSFHLALSDHHVPRWFTEGLAMWEQRRAQPGWGHSVTPLFLSVYDDGALRPVSQLNEGFVRPKFPEEVSLSYFLASLVLERIETEYGFDAVLGFLEGYAQGSTTNELFESVLGVDAEDFDETFDAYVRDRFATAFASTTGAQALPAPQAPDSSENVMAVRQLDPNGFMGQLRQGIEQFEAGNLAAAVPLLERANELFPEYGGPDSPLWYLGQIHETSGDLDRAESALAQLKTQSEHHFPAAEALAAVRGRLGDLEGATEALGRVLEINPFTAEPHRTRAELFEGMGDWDQAALERQALAALDPVDRAEALYMWARALHRAGRADEARTRVVEALEIAPGYEEALELLLEIRGGDR